MSLEREEQVLLRVRIINKATRKIILMQKDCLLVFWGLVSFSLLKQLFILESQVKQYITLECSELYSFRHVLIKIENILIVFLFESELLFHSLHLTFSVITLYFSLSKFIIAHILYSRWLYLEPLCEEQWISLMQTERSQRCCSWEFRGNVERGDTIRHLIIYLSLQIDGWSCNLGHELKMEGSSCWG